MTAKNTLLSTLVIVMGAGLLGAGSAGAADKPISTETLREMWRANPAMVQADELGDYIEDYRLEAEKVAAASTLPRSRPAQEAEVKTQASALSQIWRSNPIFAQTDELSDYGDDYRVAADAGQKTGPVFGGYVTAGFARVTGAEVAKTTDRQAQLRNLWHSDPRFSQVDELSEREVRVTCNETLRVMLPEERPSRVLPTHRFEVPWYRRVRRTAGSERTILLTRALRASCAPAPGPRPDRDDATG